MDTDSQRAQLAAVTTRLASRFTWLSSEEVDRAVHAAEAGLSAAAIREFIPLLVEKEVRDQLRTRERQGVAGSRDEMPPRQQVLATGADD